MTLPKGLSDVTVGCDESTEDSGFSERCVALITGPKGWVGVYLQDFIIAEDCHEGYCSY